MRLFGIFIWLCILIDPLFGQVDTIVHFDSVVILEKSIRAHSLGSKSEAFSLEKADFLPVLNLAQLMKESGLLFIKSYGIGSLATSSFRGGNASQTLVLWNGLPIQNPMLGQLDFSLLPMPFFDELSVNAGGESSSWGSGSMAGMIAVHTKAASKDAVKIGLDVGSFNHYVQNFRVDFGGKKLRSSTRFKIESSENDFNYKPFPGAENTRLAHAKFKQIGFLQTLNYEFSRNRELGVHFWWQNTERDIPPLLTQVRSQAAQQDEAIRIAMLYKQIKARSKEEIRMGLFNEKNTFEDQEIRILNKNEFSTGLLDYHREWFLKPWFRFAFGTTHSITRASAPAYNRQVSDYQGAAFINNRFDIKRFTVLASLRKQWARQQKVPLIPSLAIEYPFTSLATFKGKISRDYRLPTLNDRFWMPGGNADLKSENGWSEEIGLVLAGTHSSIDWQYEITTYNRKIHNWIIWSRLEDQSFFSPQNIAKVWSRGIEQNLDIKYLWNGGEQFLGLKMNASFQKSTNEIAIGNPQLAEGEQLIYTPRYQAGFKSTLALKKMNFTYRHLLTGGYRGINLNLPPYDLGYIDVNVKWTLFNQDGVAYLRINNIWNREYQVIENRPMPGLNFMTGIKLDMVNF